MRHLPNILTNNWGTFDNFKKTIGLSLFSQIDNSVIKSVKYLIKHIQQKKVKGFQLSVFNMNCKLISQYVQPLLIEANYFDRTCTYIPNAVIEIWWRLLRLGASKQSIHCWQVASSWKPYHVVKTQSFDIC